MNSQYYVFELWGRIAPVIYFLLTHYSMSHLCYEKPIETYDGCLFVMLVCCCHIVQHKVEIGTDITGYVVLAACVLKLTDRNIL